MELWHRGQLLHHDIALALSLSYVVRAWRAMLPCLRLRAYASWEGRVMGAWPKLPR